MKLLRVEFQSCLYLVYLFLACPSLAQVEVRADATQVESRIKALSKYGANPEGGVSRLAFSEADIQGREYIMTLMEDAGLEVNVDVAGNIVGKRKGNNSKLPSILFGSHIDSVPHGGNYDGDVGVIGSLECIELLNEAGIVTEHPLEVIVFSDEEGGLTGSQAMIGALKADDLQRISNSGKTIAQGIRDIGGNPESLGAAKRDPAEIKAFLELHIEQGAVLDNETLDIGVVTGIVSIEEWEITVKGMANHAGTTPMNLREDALLAASKLIVVINEITRATPGQQVATVGKIKVEPGAPNVIPGKAVLVMELRDLSREKIFSILDQVKQQSGTIEKETGTTISFQSQHLDILPAITDRRIQNMIAKSAEELGLNSKFMPSGAGHDAQEMAAITPTGMIFVPSKKGISHSPFEYTSPQDMANGADVLFHTILRIDQTGN
jgi:N-carbamoyl-L-amino-acid hydrolase